MSVDNTNKPAIVIVPGMFHQPWHYRQLHESLQKTGYEVTTCDLPSMDSKVPVHDMSADIAVVQAAVKNYIDLDLNVVLVMHSYGGMVGTSAAEGLLPKDQLNGKGVVSLAYIAALVPDVGVSLSSAGGGVHPPWFRRIEADSGTGYSVFPDKPPWNPKDLFYYDCTPEVAGEAVEKLRLMSEGPSFSECIYAAWKEVDSYYLMTEDDRAFPLWAQEAMVSQQGGRWVTIEKIQAGHSPFLSRPEETAGFVRRVCG